MFGDEGFNSLEVDGENGMDWDVDGLFKDEKESVGDDDNDGKDIEEEAVESVSTLTPASTTF